MAFKWGSHSVVSVFIFASLLAARKYGLQSAFWRVYIRHVLNKTQTLSLPFIRACEECLSWVASCLRREHVFCAIILIQEVHKRRLIFPRFFNNFNYDLVVSWKWQERHLYWLSHSIKTPEDCKTWFLILLFFKKKGSIVWDIWVRRSSCHSLWQEFTCFHSHKKWMPPGHPPRLSNDWCILS